MASVTICSDFGAQENKICNNLVFPKYAWSNKLLEIFFIIIDPRSFQGDSDYIAVEILANISRSLLSSVYICKTPIHSRMW